MEVMLNFQSLFNVTHDIKKLLQSWHQVLKSWQRLFDANSGIVIYIRNHLDSPLNIKGMEYRIEQKEQLQISLKTTEARL